MDTMDVDPGYTTDRNRISDQENITESWMEEDSWMEDESSMEGDLLTEKLVYAIASNSKRMALNISPDYVPVWDPIHAFRELYQNWYAFPIRAIYVSSTRS